MAHGAALRLRSKDPVFADAVHTNYRRADLEPREVAMLDFAVKLTHRGDHIVERDLDVLRQAGWADEDILHIIEITAMFNFTGRLANALGLLANPEYSTLGRMPREATHEAPARAGS